MLRGRPFHGQCSLIKSAENCDSLHRVAKIERTVHRNQNDWVSILGTVPALLLEGRGGQYSSGLGCSSKGEGCPRESLAKSLCKPLRETGPRQRSIARFVIVRGLRTISSAVSQCDRSTSTAPSQDDNHLAGQADRDHQPGSSKELQRVADEPAPDSGSCPRECHASD